MIIRYIVYAHCRDRERSGRGRIEWLCHWHHRDHRQLVGVKSTHFIAETWIQPNQHSFLGIPFQSLAEIVAFQNLRRTYPTPDQSLFVGIPRIPSKGRSVESTPRGTGFLFLRFQLFVTLLNGNVGGSIVLIQLFVFSQSIIYLIYFNLIYI